MKFSRKNQRRIFSTAYFAVMFLIIVWQPRDYGYSQSLFNLESQQKFNGEKYGIWLDGESTREWYWDSPVNSVYNELALQSDYSSSYNPKNGVLNLKTNILTWDDQEKEFDKNFLSRIWFGEPLDNLTPETEKTVHEVYEIINSAADGSLPYRKYRTKYLKFSDGFYTEENNEESYLRYHNLIIFLFFITFYSYMDKKFFPEFQDLSRKTRTSYKFMKEDLAKLKKEQDTPQNSSHE